LEGGIAKEYPSRSNGYGFYGIPSLFRGDAIDCVASQHPVDVFQRLGYILNVPFPRLKFSGRHHGGFAVPAVTKSPSRHQVHGDFQHDGFMFFNLFAELADIDFLCGKHANSPEKN
jgi:hypothetical protein